MSVETVDLNTVKIAPGWALKIQPTLAMRRLALPLCVVDDELVVAMADPTDTATQDAIAAQTGKKVRAVRTQADALRRMLLRVYGDTHRTAGGATGDDPVALVDDMMRAATLRHASDIHIDPDRDGVRVRFRVDGQLEDFIHLPASVQQTFTSRIKVLSRLDIAERRAPQDGAFTWHLTQGAQVVPYDVRVATIPVKHGERITLRLLETGTKRLTLDGLGFSEGHLHEFETMLKRPHGLVLMTGPTGSGKTTTLYAAIQVLLESAPLNILTVEDPVEYEIDGIAQVEVESSDKVNFSKALRSLLRHDPDVVMIGEIRDAESLDTAVKAALTGHLVLSTLHTNDAVSAVTRLKDMGLERHLIAATLRLSAAQRLVRRLCPHCRREHVIAEADALALGRPSLSGLKAYEPHGCLTCAGRGFDGRTGVFELVLPDSDFASAIASGAPEGELRRMLRARGVPTLADDAVRKVGAGETALGEVVNLMAGY